MKLASAASLDWQTGVATTHALHLNLGISTSELLVTDDPALEFATRSAGIRAEIAAAFIDGHMPGILSSTGEDVRVPGELASETATRWTARTALTRAGGVAVEGTMDIAIHVETSRPVTAIQALAANRAAVAAAVAECIVGKLKRELLGIEATASHSSSRVVDGRTAAYQAREVGLGPITN